MKQSDDNSTTPTRAQSKTRSRGAERLELVRRGRDQGKSNREIARDLGCDEGTVRRDLKKLRLPEDQLIAIQEGDPAEQYLDKARFEKTGIDQKVRKIRRKRLLTEKVTGVPSDEAANAVSAWLVKKEPYTAVQQLLLKHVGQYCKNIPDRQRAPRSDTAKVFALCEAGEMLKPSTDRADFHVRVLASALVHIAPEKLIRDSAIKKAQQAARTREPYPPEPAGWEKQRAVQRKRRRLRDRTYEA
jgi:hypothetical protein